MTKGIATKKRALHFICVGLSGEKTPIQTNKKKHSHPPPKKKNTQKKTHDGRSFFSRSLWMARLLQRSDHCTVIRALGLHLYVCQEQGIGLTLHTRESIQPETLLHSEEPLCWTYVDSSSHDQVWRLVEQVLRNRLQITSYRYMEEHKDPVTIPSHLYGFSVSPTEMLRLFYILYDVSILMPDGSLGYFPELSVARTAISPNVRFRMDPRTHRLYMYSNASLDSNEEIKIPLLLT
jgi:hypothetical protein